MPSHIYAPPTPSPDGPAPTPTATVGTPGSPTPGMLPQTGVGDGNVPWLLIVAFMLIGAGVTLVLRRTRRRGAH